MIIQTVNIIIKTSFSKDYVHRNNQIRPWECNNICIKYEIDTKLHKFTCNYVRGNIIKYQIYLYRTHNITCE